MSDVAAAAGVSKATVSLALSGSRSVRLETRRRVTAAASQLRYVAPRQRSPKASRSGTLGILLDREFSWVGEEFFTRIARAFQEEAEGEGFECVISALSREQIAGGAVPSLLLGDEVEALAIVGITNPSLLESCRRAGKPGVVVSGGTAAPDTFDAVLNDDFGGVSRILHHLRDLGHREVAFIGGRLDHHSNLNRARAFRVLTEELLGGHDRRLLRVDSGETSAAAGRRLCRELLEQGVAFTALACMTDDLAHGALEELARAGVRVPGDVSVVGFDDLARSQATSPPLTTVRVSCDEIGQAGYQLLKIRLGASPGHHPMRIEIGAELVIRASTGPRRPPGP